MSFLNPPSFQTGDVLSASKVNHLLTDIDTLYGWYYGPNYGFDNAWAGTPPGGWGGWCILTGDTLVVQLSTFSGGAIAKVYFDGTQIGVGTGYTSAGTYNIALPSGSEAWQPWQPYRVSITNTQPSGTGEFNVVRVFLKDSSIPSSGTLPDFADGDTSSAADFNAISNGIRNVEPLVVQPVIGCRGGEGYGDAFVGGSNSGWVIAQSWSIQHRVNALRCSLFIQGSWGPGTISARLRYNGVPVNGAEWTVGPLSSRRITDKVFALPTTPPLAIGTFYNVDIQIRQDPAWQSGWHVSPAYVYEDQLGLPAGYYETLRWEHGDYAAGDSDNPGLFVMRENLNAINVNATACGAINVVQMEPIFTSQPLVEPEARRFYHVRRWRWLAYNRQQWDASGPEATVNWTYDGVTWDSYTLPDVEDGGFYDLDSSPIVPGLLFYVSGVQYAIQTPYTY